MRCHTTTVCFNRSWHISTTPNTTKKKIVRVQTNTVVFYGHPELSGEEKSKFEFEEKKFRKVKVDTSEEKKSYFCITEAQWTIFNNWSWIWFLCLQSKYSIFDGILWCYWWVWFGSYVFAFCCNCQSIFWEEKGISNWFGWLWFRQVF